MNRKNFVGHVHTLLIHLLKNNKIDKTALIIKPLKIDNIHAISVGSYVYIGELSWLMGGFEKGRITLKIDSRAQIGHFAHIVALKSVHIEENVLLADKVFISDCTHEYDDIQSPILEQKVNFLKPVIIGEGSWLGENVCVCGANVGKHCVIAANSVVTKDIPDYCVAAGSPAHIVKKYNFDTKTWEKV